ncbi:MAG: short-chain dehydrogenase/reductase [Rhizorhabdus sp.]|nr:short-chain dehydrogenase/reductase [Rhizorhabdus sp.]
MQRFDGKRVVIAGGGSGIGAAASERLAREGAKVVVGDINEAGAKAVVERISAAGGIAIAQAFDLADETSTNALIQTAVDAFGGIDGLANVGADLSPATMAGDLDVLDMDLAIWERTMRVNVIGHAFTCREAIRNFVHQGTGGAIVNISSEAASCGEDTRPAYAASKAGVNALMRQIALRWGKEGIRCNCVAPGITMSATAEEQMPADFKQQWLDLTTMKRFGRPEDLAATVLFLLSDDAAWVSGQVWHVNGGSHFHG